MDGSATMSMVVVVVVDLFLFKKEEKCGCMAGQWMDDALPKIDG